MIYVPCQRRGYAHEAAAAVIGHLREMHGVQRILADVSTRNIASIRVLESLGFSRTSERDAGHGREAGREFVYALER